LNCLEIWGWKENYEEVFLRKPCPDKLLEQMPFSLLSTLLGTQNKKAEKGI